MAISKAYSESLKRRAVQRFVKDNKRAPTEAELRILVQKEEESYASVDKVGLIGYDLKKPQFGKASSAADENTNRKAMIDDALTISTRIDNLTELLEGSFRGFYGSTKRVKRKLGQLESRLDNLLLMHGDTSAFTAGIEEEFLSQEFVVHGNTDAAVEAGYVTVNRTGYQAIDLESAVLKTSVLAEKGILSRTSNSPISTLKHDDGQFWENLVYTDYASGRVSLATEIELPTPAYVNEVRFTASTINVNSQMTATCFYSLDGKTFEPLLPVERVITTEENMFNIGLENVHKIQIVLSKSAADTTVKRQHVYLFNLDSLSVFSSPFKNTSYSTIELGPYLVKDGEENDVFFTKALFHACTEEPSDTSCAFFLSQDGTNWVPADHNGDNLNYISFGDGSASVASAVIDSTRNEDVLIDTSVFDPTLTATIEEVDFATESILNRYVTAAYSAKVPLNSYVVKRNVVGTSSPDTLLGGVPGWRFDPVTLNYSTTVYVSALEGRNIDFGPTGVVLNGTLKSGVVFLSTGYHTIATSDSNFQAVESGASSLDDLKARDPLYPYNHKLLIEGYTHSSAFTGEQIYTGVDEYFGSKLTYMPPEMFASLSSGDPRYYTTFTLENIDDNLYFKVKVDKTDATWTSELISTDWLVQSAATNTLYVKGVLASSDTTSTPVVHSVKVRVI